MHCLFCNFVNGKSPISLTYEDDRVVAFNDIKPKAPFHILIIPKKHIATLNNMSENDRPLLGQMLHVAKQLAIQLGISQSGYRAVFNCNANGGQTIFHIHLHLLGGRQMLWPPG